jgi:hypothetical protein
MHGYRGKIRKKYALVIKRKRRWKNTEYKHRIQSHDAHRHCTLSIKRRCAIISNMEITNMKGGRKRLPVRSPKINKKSTA